MSDQIIGTCSLCDGPVKMPSMMVDPVARCARCGAVPKAPYGPVVEMTKPTRVVVDPDGYGETTDQILRRIRQHREESSRAD